MTQPAPWNAHADLTGYEHAGWHCEHYDMTLLPDVAPSSRIVNARCGCRMVPVYAKRAGLTADTPAMTACLMCGATDGLWPCEDGWACKDLRPCAKRAQDAKQARTGRV